MKGPLVIVACGKSKIWDKQKRAGSTRAEEVYVGAPFKVNKEYAKRFGQRWLILSAKYGYINPAFKISRAYNVTFKNLKTKPVSTAILQRQVKTKRLDRYKTVIGLGGWDYRETIKASFAESGARLHFPTNNLPLWKAMQRVKKITLEGKPLG